MQFQAPASLLTVGVLLMRPCFSCKHMSCLWCLQELKGNIRVFCRVRPVSAAEQGNAEHDSALAVEFPPSTDILSAGIVLQVGYCPQLQLEALSSMLL